MPLSNRNRRWAREAGLRRATVLRGRASATVLRLSDCRLLFVDRPSLAELDASPSMIDRFASIHRRGNVAWQRRALLKGLPDPHGHVDQTGR